MKMTLNAFETEASNLKIEIQMKSSENKRLKERIDTLERDNQQVNNIVQFKNYYLKFYSLANKHLSRI
jgi:hypothetical protein